jgi:hypothetical protein
MLKDQQVGITRMASVLRGAGVLVFLLCLINRPAEAAPNHLAQVTVKADRAVDTDLFLRFSPAPVSGILVWAGEPQTAQITYQVGTGQAEGGAFQLVRNEIPNPEYRLFCPPGAGCAFWGKIAVSVDEASGALALRAAGPGGYLFLPAVRDKVNGEHPYKGRGFWWTEFNVANGKTYFSSKTPFGAVAIRRPTAKDVALTCTFTDPAMASTKLVLEYGDKLALVYGADGGVAGVYGIDPASDVLGWTRWPGVDASSVSLDRTTGELSVSMNGALPTRSAQCVRRAVERVF